jgi:hypothetical protein
VRLVIAQDVGQKNLIVVTADAAGVWDARVLKSPGALSSTQIRLVYINAVLAPPINIYGGNLSEVVATPINHSFGLGNVALFNQAPNPSQQISLIVDRDGSTIGAYSFPATDNDVNKQLLIAYVERSDPIS